MLDLSSVLSVNQELFIGLEAVVSNQTSWYFGSN